MVCTCKPRLVVVPGDNYCDSEQKPSYHYKLWALHLSPWGYVEGAETTMQWHYPVILPHQIRAILRNRPTANNSLTKLYICSLLLCCDPERITAQCTPAERVTFQSHGPRRRWLVRPAPRGTTSTANVSPHRHMTPYTHQQLCGTATHVVSPTIRQHYLT